MTKACILACSMLFGVMLANASTIFNINETVGAGSLTGTVNTDGTIGVLSAANILDWNLIINNGSSTFNLKGPSSGNNSQVFLPGNDLTETASALFFNFSGVDGGMLLFQSPTIGSGSEYVCIASTTICDLSPAGISLCLTNCAPQPGNNQFTALSGTQQISGSAVPEPSSAVLLGLGAGALFALRVSLRRRKPLVLTRETRC